ncbi:MAG TPA: hypothetical protein VMW47_07675 [Verrucomicrobiae bacterium]|nr:hypothetical protein [Verrucomicrobiae bacterium]
MTDSNTTVPPAAGFRPEDAAVPRLLHLESRDSAGETWRAEWPDARPAVVRVCPGAATAAGRRAAADLARLLKLDAPSLVPVAAVLTVRGQLWVVREPVTGVSLRRLIPVVALTPGQVALVGLAVLEALSELQRAGLRHGAVQAETVWVGDDGRVRVTDAALPRSPAGPRIRPPADPSRSAPDLDAPADLVATGALLSAMLEGAPATSAAAHAGLLVTPGAAQHEALARAAAALAGDRARPQQTGTAGSTGAAGRALVEAAWAAWQRAAGPLGGDAEQAVCRAELAALVRRLHPRARPVASALPVWRPAGPSGVPDATPIPGPGPIRPQTRSGRRIGRAAAAAMTGALLVAVGAAILLAGGLGGRVARSPGVPVPTPPGASRGRTHPGRLPPARPTLAPTRAPLPRPTPATTPARRSTPPAGRGPLSATLPADLAPLPALGPGSAGAVEGVSITTAPAGCTRSATGCSVVIRIDLGSHPSEPIGWALDLVDACTGRVVAGPAGQYTAPAPFTYVEAEASVTPASVAGEPVPVAVVAVTTTPARVAATPAYLVPPGASCRA